MLSKDEDDRLPIDVTNGFTAYSNDPQGGRDVDRFLIQDIEQLNGSTLYVLPDKSVIEDFPQSGSQKEIFQTRIEYIIIYERVNRGGSYYELAPTRSFMRIGDNERIWIDLALEEDGPNVTHTGEYIVEIWTSLPPDWFNGLEGVDIKYSGKYLITSDPDGREKAWGADWLQVVPYDSIGGNGSDPETRTPVISVSDASIAEGSAPGGREIVFRIELSEASSDTIYVTYSVDGKTAIVGEDFQSNDGLIAFSPGETTQFVRVNIIHDLDMEPDETLTITLTNPDNATIGRGVATGTIINDDDGEGHPLSPFPSNTGFQPLTPVGDSRLKIMTSSFDADELTGIYSVVGVANDVAGGKDELLQLSSDDMVQKIYEWAIDSASEPVKRFLQQWNETKDVGAVVEKNIFDGVQLVFDIGNSIADDDPEFNAGAKVREIDRWFEKTRKDSLKLFGDLVGARIADWLRVGTSHSAISFSADLDITDRKAEIKAASGHTDTWLGSTGRDRIFLGDKNDFAWGGYGNDVLIGEAGNDILAGSQGNDVLVGGAGNDLFFGGAGNDMLRGDGGSDRMMGDAGDDRLLGGDGADTLIGGKGNDSLAGGLGADRLFGGAGVDRLIGGDGPDYLDGGQGPDVMFGGAGPDVYIVDNIGDQVIEPATKEDFTEIEEMPDQIISFVSYVLPRFVEVMNLTGTADTNGTGNEMNNFLFGNSGDNLLRGLDGDDHISGGSGNDMISGGDGSDNLTGGPGADIFLFDSDPQNMSQDLIQDFQHDEGDRILLSKTFFSGFDYTGTIRSEDFRAGWMETEPWDASDRLIYDTSSGILYYDKDGIGGEVATVVAWLGSWKHPALGFVDIEIIA